MASTSYTCIHCNTGVPHYYCMHCKTGCQSILGVIVMDAIITGFRIIAAPAGYYIPVRKFLCVLSEKLA